MRSSDRRSAVLISSILLTVSCAIEPVPDAVVRLIAPAGAQAVATTGPRDVATEVREITRILSDRNAGLLPAEVVHVSRVIVTEAHRVGLPPSFVLAVIEVESSGRNFVESNVGAIGLMQIMPATGKFVADQLDVPWNGRETLFDPVVNVRLGIHYLQTLIDRYGDVRIALAAYNAGPGVIARHIRSGDPVPHRYADRVLAAYAAVGEAI